MLILLLLLLQHLFLPTTVVIIPVKNAVDRSSFSSLVIAAKSALERAEFVGSGYSSCRCCCCRVTTSIKNPRCAVDGNVRQMSRTEHGMPVIFPSIIACVVAIAHVSTHKA